jgi:hypothetical protein
MQIRCAIILTAIIAVASAHADPTAAARDVVEGTAAEVERDLASRSGNSAGPEAASLDFDPISRAQGELASWTSVPSRSELARRSRIGGAPGAILPVPGGLAKQYFPRLGTSLIFPQNAETARAIRRMANGQVSAIPNYCARTVREALGWGLGDAHDWTALPRRGYTERPAGTAAQPGDIVVWPFTYGSGNSQHIGIAVGTDSGTRLLSNLSGDLGLTRMLPGYRAYWKA